jgi:hypothetical protein
MRHMSLWDLIEIVYYKEEQRKILDYHDDDVNAYNDLEVKFNDFLEELREFCEERI